MRATLLMVSVLAALYAGPALAQSAPTSSEAARAVIGAWEISNADRDRTCAVVFKAEPVPGGLKIEFDRACAAVFPVTRDVVAWTVVVPVAAEVITTVHEGVAAVRGQVFAPPTKLPGPFVIDAVAV